MEKDVFYLVRENQEWHEDNAYVQEERIYNYKTKKDAFQHFLKSVREHYRRDFWNSIGWDDETVWTLHSDEAGYTECILEKWEGFDKEVELGWEYNGDVFKSANELEKEYPNEFKKSIVWTHHDYCGLASECGPIAKLSIKYSEGLR